MRRRTARSAGWKFVTCTSSRGSPRARRRRRAASRSIRRRRWPVWGRRVARWRRSWARSRLWSRESRRTVCGGRWSQQLLHDDRVDPPVVEHALLLVDADGAEPHPLVEGHATAVARKRRQHHLVKAMLARQLDQPRQHDLSDPPATIGAVDVDREVDDVPVCLPRIELIQAPPGYCNERAICG